MNYIYMGHMNSVQQATEKKNYYYTSVSMHIIVTTIMLKFHGTKTYW